MDEETKIACPMGIAFGPDGDIYICDNQGWSGKEELLFKGRMLRLKIENNQVVKTTVVCLRHGTPEWRADSWRLYVCHPKFALQGE